MERQSYPNPTEVSAYWTPQHLDVTDAPLAYAAPRAPWIDGYRRLRPLVRIDAEDRMARRRMQTHAIVDPAEIATLPPIARAAAPSRSNGVREFGRHAVDVAARIGPACRALRGPLSRAVR